MLANVSVIMQNKKLKLHFQDNTNFKNKSTTYAHLSGSLFYLKFLVKKGYNSKNIPFRVMPLVLQTALCHDEQEF